MSYCRFSSDNWMSDVYCYEDVSGGFTIHVAANRLSKELPKLPSPLDTPSEEWLRAYQAQAKAYDETPRVPICGPHDGACFRAETLEDCLERLLELREAGYQVPRDALAALAEEIKAKEVA